MSDFDKALPYVLENEGVDSDHPADTGGRTRYGITRAVAEFHGYDVESLTLENAGSIYKAAYWKFDGIADQRVATKLFDMCVNFGVPAATKIAQAIARVTVDGVYGRQTERGINNIHPERMLTRLAELSRERYLAIIARNPSQKVFRNGWLRRAARLPEAS